MKVRKISSHITKLEVSIGIKFSAWLIQAEDGVTIIDTGLPFMGKAILREARKLGKIKAVLLTHGHGDHVGGLSYIAKEERIPVFAHKIELPYIEGVKPFPGKKKLENLVEIGLVQPLPTDENHQLLPIQGLIPYLTPGHSPGHVVYYHPEDSVLISGDLFTSKRGKLQKPAKMFTPHMSEAIASGAIVKELKPVLVSITHSKDVHHAYEHIDQYLQQL
ncbi:MBL fold metallo-hydrolase [Paenibacillus radicis (ex Gao et al. 2016)]|uniref:Metallo-hydrolase YybB n=1 Tax=Paenibacillus radicis (ex Gao et al. 2016) TaxID=1737354 RepID=A0A917GWL1_9BACL|nr:MBL fold metallo-hydrolase [Paenibacillus radicis (ex Gao et al. 2016)]GGG59513.1 putative metallo-hydrolase YybB [Paenibacillus radicis (ex Gao et al. 2016)]